MEECTICWLIENRLLYIKRPAIIDMEMLEADSQRIITMLDAGEAPVHIINDALDVNMTPKNARMMRNALPYLDHPNLGWLVTVTSNAFISFLASIIPQMRRNNNNNVKVVHSVDEAITFLDECESEVDWSYARERVP